jgi:hypothetical protein
MTSGSGIHQPGSGVKALSVDIGGRECRRRPDYLDPSQQGISKTLSAPPTAKTSLLSPP